MKVTSFTKSPMGSYFVNGYVNNNQKYYFKILISSVNEFQFIKEVGYNPKTLGKLFKEEEAKNKIGADEIIKKEHLDKEKYEAQPPFILGDIK
ncbi:DUF1433 domain-containing protein [Staphylococcus lugdunensis]|nr:DUF1433 domain-containing protein [Staphylococcus lugdunensis]MCH8648431.1 DUF1433 domain-containing protein [Staphylococcus lugdunensis]MCH8660493.1 DUF1433 domain-containing protein [Staphylococcus lugdunensis]MCH8679234.1 DUF1433 domain-containing protein [Staphylococcus lugdunensis]MCH8681727.1 DUF1433 domain-containing protein [Staphylococcus lugdunensis]MCI2225548.1 DUF1433 domain-containing protein [Staphylococcus lugdunensis]